MIKVIFKKPFYHNELGLIPRKQDGVGSIVEVDDKLISSLPLNDLKIVEATDGQRRIYDKRVEAAKQKRYTAQHNANVKEAKQQTDLLITLVESLKGLPSPVVAQAVVKE